MSMFPEETGIPQVKNIIKRIEEIELILKLHMKYKICPCGLTICDELEKPVNEILELIGKLRKEIDIL